MKIIELRAENIKRLVAVSIKPDGNMVEITGRNGQGKSSVLDAIWWALEGSEHIQSVPIRKGATEAVIRLDLGEIKVTRTFKSKDDGYTTSIVVEQENGARFQKPQSVLDSLLGELAFDPLAFTRMKPKEQFDTLRQFVPGVDFAAIDEMNKADFDARTDINRRLKEVNAQLAGTTIPLNPPSAMIDEGQLVADLEKAGEFNSNIERKRASREAFIGETKREIDRHSAIAASIDDLRKQIERSEAEMKALGADITDRENRIAQAEPLPEPIDTAKVRAAISHAKSNNEAFQAAQRAIDTAKKLKDSAIALEARSTALTEAMQKRSSEKQRAVAEAKMPIDGIAFGEGHVLLNGVPFEQASDAERLRASIAIAAAMNPKLRVIRVRDGSLLDEAALALLSSFATENDFQIWIERVDSSGRVGFVMEDGHLKTQTDDAVAA